MHVEGIYEGYTVFTHDREELVNPRSIYSYEKPGAVKAGDIRIIEGCIWYVSTIEKITQDRALPLEMLFGPKHVRDQVWWRRVPEKSTKAIEDIQYRLMLIENWINSPAPWCTVDDVKALIDDALATDPFITAVELEDTMLNHLKIYKHKEQKNG